MYQNSSWKKVANVPAIPLPLGCKLFGFIAGHRYYFTICAVDGRRVGPYSDVQSIYLGQHVALQQQVAKFPPPKPWLKVEAVMLKQNRGVILSWDIAADVSR